MIFPYALFKFLFLFSEEDDIEPLFIDYLEAHGLSGDTIDEYLIKLVECKKQLEEDYLQQQAQDQKKQISASLEALNAENDEYEDIFDEKGMWIGKRKLPRK